MKSIVEAIKNPFLSYPDKTERFVYLLIFLFPIAGMSVRSWITTIFNILVLIGLFALRRNAPPLIKYEKIFLWICAAYFSMYIVSALVNDWGPVQTRYLGTELRFILIIPLYLLVRQYSDCAVWLLRGSVVAGFFLLSQALYDIFVMGHATALGVYSKNIIGPFSVLVGFWGLYLFWQNRSNYKWFLSFAILLSVLSALIAAALSGSRGGYVGFLITGLSCVLFFSRPRWMLASLLVIFLTTFLFYQNVSIVNNGVNKAVDEAAQYIKSDELEKNKSSLTPTGVRLEMLRSGYLFVRDNPLFGIGPGNYKKRIGRYIEEGKINYKVGFYAHPHNTFMEVASAKGLLGLITVLLLFYYPAYIFIKGYKLCKKTASLGLIHIVAISAFSLTDHSVVLMNNYTSILLLGMAIFISNHIRACKQHL